MKQGAFDYVAKPLDLEELWLVIQRAWDAERARGELALPPPAGRTQRAGREPARRLPGHGGGPPAHPAGGGRPTASETPGPRCS